MINFHASTFTWMGHPIKPDPYYKYSGGFVGRFGQVYQVRFNLEAACQVLDEASGHVSEMFLGAPCRAEYTIASRNLFQVPSNEFRMAFSREHVLPIATGPSDEPEQTPVRKLNESFQGYKIDIRHHKGSSELTDVRAIIYATLANDLLSARSTYRDSERSLTVTCEYPVNLINVNEDDGEFQVCTGPVILPDLATWDGDDVRRVFLAHVALTRFDHVEFILRREVEAAPEERAWLDQPRGRDRLELLDSDNPPPGYPPLRPAPTVYNEVWEFEATNAVLRAANG